MVIPIKLKERHRHGGHRQGHRHVRELLNDEVNGCRRQRRLPDDPDRDVDHVPAEITVLLQSGVVLLQRFAHGLPETPRPRFVVEAFERFHIIGLRREATYHAADQGEQQVEREGFQRANGFGQHLRQDHRRGDPRHHPPEVAVAVEPPPVPLQHVGRRVPPEERPDEPVDQTVQTSPEDAHEGADDDDQDGDQVAQPHVFPLGSRIVDVPLVEVVDDVGRRGIHRGGEGGHEGG